MLNGVVDLLRHETSEMRGGDVAVASVVFEDFWAEDLVAEVLDGFGREELEGLGDCHG